MISFVIKKNIKEFNDKGFSIFPKKIITLIKVIFLVPIYLFSLPILLIVRLLRPFILIRFSKIISNRIGHFSSIYNVYLAEKELSINQPPKKSIDFFIFSEICNSQIANFYKRKLNILPSYIFGPLINLNKLIPGGLIHEAIFNSRDKLFYQIKYWPRDVNNSIDKTNIQVKFTEKEIEEAKHQLQKISIKNPNKIVMLHVRDDGYLEKKSSSVYENKDWSYLSVRNSNINNFLSGVKYLIDSGYTVIRYGKNPKNNLNLQDENYIDLANNPHRTDLLEMYLISKSLFCIGSDSGGTEFPHWLFRKPLLLVNYLPLSLLYTHSDKITTCSKVYYNKLDNKKLTISEILSNKYSNLQTTDDFEKNNIRLEECSSEDIKFFIEEMKLKIEGKWNVTDEEINLKKKFIDIYQRNLNKNNWFSQQHGEIRCNFGFHFLKKNKDIIK